MGGSPRRCPGPGATGAARTHPLSDALNPRPRPRRPSPRESPGRRPYPVGQRADRPHRRASRVGPGKATPAALARAMAHPLVATAAPTALWRTAPGWWWRRGAPVDAFPSVAHLSAWARLAPGQHESAGNRKSARIPPGPCPLRTVLAPWAECDPRPAYVLGGVVCPRSPAWGKSGPWSALRIAAREPVLQAPPRGVLCRPGAGPLHPGDDTRVTRRALEPLHRQGDRVTLTRPLTSPRAPAPGEGCAALSTLACPVSRRPLRVRCDRHRWRLRTGRR